MEWRMCASTTLLPNTPSLVWTEMAMWCTRHWKTDVQMFNPNKENERESYFYSFLLLFVPFAMKPTSLQRGKMPRLPLIST